MRTPALEPKNRITLPMRRVVAFELGCDTAKAGLPLDSFFHRDEDEQEAYEAGWRTEVTHEALSAGRLAEAEGVLDRTEKQPSWRTWAAKWWHTFIWWEGNA